MNEYEVKELIRETKELCDIRDEYQKAQKLLQEQNWDELQNHISNVILKHPTEAMVHNLVNRCMPTTIEQNAINCMDFLENLFKCKLGMDTVDITKYLIK